MVRPCTGSEDEEPDPEQGSECRPCTGVRRLMSQTLNRVRKYADPVQGSNGISDRTLNRSLGFRETLCRGRTVSVELDPGPPHDPLHESEPLASEARGDNDESCDAATASACDLLLENLH